MTKELNIFSYSLFEPKYLPEHRNWDKWKNENSRYWYNIPAILLLNKIIYPEYKSVFYFSKNIWDNPLSKVFDCFDADVEYNTIDLDYNSTEPAIWRMMPLWRRDVQIFHTRDLDSLTSESEFKYIKAFEDSNCTIGTIRSHMNHYGIACGMLAGLSSFKPKKISPNIKGHNFNFYYSLRENKYGSDQELMVKVFTLNNEFTKNNFLDCAIDFQNNPQYFNCIVADLKQVDIPLELKSVFLKIKELTNTSWLGEPCDSRGELLKYLLSVQSEQKIIDKLYSNKLLKDFYLL